MCIVTCCTKRKPIIIKTLSVKPDNSKSLYRITNTLPGNIRNIVLPDCDDIVLLAKKFQFYFSSKVEDSLGKLQKITVNNINLLKHTPFLAFVAYV